MKIILIGYMGSGKSSVGISLGTVLNLPFFDLDAVIEDKLEMTVSEIFNKKGEIFFRRKEQDVLYELLNTEKMILALGGGTPCYGTILEDLKNRQDILLVYLKTSVQELTNRLWVEKHKRPLISHLNDKIVLEDFIRKHLFERNYYYSQASIKINTDESKISEIVQHIVKTLF